MGTTAIAMAALAVVAFLVLAVVLWRGNVEIISGFPEEAGSLKEAEKAWAAAWLPWFCSSCLWRF